MLSHPFFRVVVFTVLLLVTAAPHARGQQSSADTAVTVKLGAFVDGYFAFDFGRPGAIDRAFTTQAARHNEFNINLAFLEARLDGARVRGRLALQAGTSVQSNYAGEPRVGALSGPDLARHLQEAVVGVKIGEKIWLDGGVYLSHIGSESWASRDNLTYTRSLIAEFSPYYQAGVKFSWQATPTLAAQLNVINGWQNIAETNGDKAVGARVDWSPSSRATLSLYNFAGNEAPDSVDRRLRLFQGASVKLVPNKRWTLQGTFDLGLQDAGAGHSTWYGAALIARVQATPRVGIAGRLERYDDKDQVIIVTGSSNPFRANGVSLGIDAVPAPRTLWRTEFRTLSGKFPLFPKRGDFSKSDVVLVSSLALTF